MPLVTVVTAASLMEALVSAIRSTEVAILLCLKRLHIVILPVHLDMSSASLSATLLRNVANDTVAKLANLRTNVFTGFKGADTDDSVANQVSVTRGRAKNEANEEERLVVDAVERFAESLDAVQLLGAITPILILMAALDNAGCVGGTADDCAAVKDTVQIADRHARSHVLGEIVGLVPGVVVGFVVEQDDTLDAMAVVVVGQGPVVAEGLVHGMNHVVLVVAVDVDV